MGSGKLAWAFDRFDPAYLSDDELVDKTVEILVHSGSLQAVEGDATKLRAFVSAVRDRYHAVPYHNWKHAFYVTLQTFRLLSNVTLACKVSDADKLTILLAAVCHDVGHVGVSNAFLVEHEKPMAVRWNNMSVLEQNSAFILNTLLRDSDTNFMARADAEVQRCIRARCIHLILSTDITDPAKQQHASAQWKSVSAAYNSSDENHTLLFLSQILQLADIGCVYEPFPIAKSWIVRLFREFSRCQPHLTAKDYFLQQTSFMANHAKTRWEQLEATGMVKLYESQLHLNLLEWTENEPEMMQTLHEAAETSRQDNGRPPLEDLEVAA